MSAHVDTSENFHPMQCNGLGKCRHCDRRLRSEVLRQIEYHDQAADDLTRAIAHGDVHRQFWPYEGPEDERPAA